MSCREFVELFLIEWLEGDLPVRRIEQCQTHLAGCAQCHRYLIAYQATRNAIAALRQST